MNNTCSTQDTDRPPMRKESTESRSESRPEWEQLEYWVPLVLACELSPGFREHLPCDAPGCFESRLLPLFVNRTRKVAELIPELYLHGLSEGDFDLALRGLLGENAPYRRARWPG